MNKDRIIWTNPKYPVAISHGPIFSCHGQKGTFLEIPFINLDTKERSVVVFDFDRAQSIKIDGERAMDAYSDLSLSGLVERSGSAWADEINKASLQTDGESHVVYKHYEFYAKDLELLSIVALSVNIIEK